MFSKQPLAKQALELGNESGLSVTSFRHMLLTYDWGGVKTPTKPTPPIQPPDPRTPLVILRVCHYLNCWWWAGEAELLSYLFLSQNLSSLIYVNSTHLPSEAKSTAFLATLNVQVDWGLWKHILPTF